MSFLPVGDLRSSAATHPKTPKKTWPANDARQPQRQKRRVRPAGDGRARAERPGKTRLKREKEPADSPGAAPPRRTDQAAMRPPLRQHALAVRGGGAEPDLHIAGKLFPALRKTVISGERLSEALAKVLDAAALADLAVIAALWLLADPLLRGWRRLRREARAAPWERSFARLWARGLKRLAATMGALYVLDLGCLAAQTMGVPLGRDDVPLLAASFLYPVWFGRLASNIKRRALRVYPSREGPVAPNGDGKVLVYDRLCDVALAVFVAVVILGAALAGAGRGLRVVGCRVGRVVRRRRPGLPGAAQARDQRPAPHVQRQVPAGRRN